MRKWILLSSVLALVLTFPAGVSATHSADEHSKNMTQVGSLPYSMGSDLGFWRRTAIAGIYGTSPTDNPGGFRLIDIGNPTNPTQIGRFECHGPQSDVSIWEDLAFVSVDSTMASEECGSGFASASQVLAGTHWEGIRVVDISDPANPTQIKGVYTDCGSHTHTLMPDLDHRTASGQRDPRVLLYVQSYPLGGQGVDCNAVTHRKISVVEVPLRHPEDAQVVSTPSVSPAVGCHDVTVFPTKDLAAAACITESQMWDISDPENPQILAHIYNPLMEIHHSTTFDFEAETLVLGDEMGGAAVSPGCLSGGTLPTGSLWFYDVTDPSSPVELSYFTIPQNEEPTDICTAHNFNTIPLSTDRDILTSAWYANGTTVVDFTNPSNPQQIGYYEPEAEGDLEEAEHWSGYWYNGFTYANNFISNRGFEVFRFRDDAVRGSLRLPFLNPQTQIPAGTRLRDL